MIGSHRFFLGLLLVSFAWLPLFGYLGPPMTGQAFLSFAIGSLLLARCFSNTIVVSTWSPRFSVGLFAVGAFALWKLGRPFWPAACALIVAGLLPLVPHRWRVRAKGLAGGTLVVATLLACQGTVWMIGEKVFSRLHAAPWLAWTTTTIGRLFGSDIRNQGHVISMQVPGGNLLLWANYEGLQVPCLLLFLSAVVVAALHANLALSRLSLVAGMTIFYAVVRYVLLVHFSALAESSIPLLSYGWTLLTLLPLIVVCTWAHRQCYLRECA